MVGTFALFSSQSVLRTNNTMRALAFATAVIRLPDRHRGILGMNFEAPFFKPVLQVLRNNWLQRKAFRSR